MGIFRKKMDMGDPYGDGYSMMSPTDDPTEIAAKQAEVGSYRPIHGDNSTEPYKQTLPEKLYYGLKAKFGNDDLYRDLEQSGSPSAWDEPVERRGGMGLVDFGKYIWRQLPFNRKKEDDLWGNW